MNNEVFEPGDIVYSNGYKFKVLEKKCYDNDTYFYRLDYNGNHEIYRYGIDLTKQKPSLWVMMRRYYKEVAGCFIRYKNKMRKYKYSDVILMVIAVGIWALFFLWLFTINH